MAFSESCIRDDEHDYVIGNRACLRAELGSERAGNSLQLLLKPQGVFGLPMNSVTPSKRTCRRSEVPAFSIASTKDRIVRLQLRPEGAEQFVLSLSASSKECGQARMAAKPAAAVLQ